MLDARPAQRYAAVCGAICCEKNEKESLGGVEVGAGHLAGGNWIGELRTSATASGEPSRRNGERRCFERCARAGTPRFKQRRTARRAHIREARSADGRGASRTASAGAQHFGRLHVDGPG